MFTNWKKNKFRCLRGNSKNVMSAKKQRSHNNQKKPLNYSKEKGDRLEDVEKTAVPTSTEKKN